MLATNRALMWIAVLGTAATVAVAGLLWAIVTHPVAVAQLLASGQ